MERQSSSGYWSRTDIDPDVLQRSIVHTVEEVG
jgi:hypothetical protein